MYAHIICKYTRACTHKSTHAHICTHYISHIRTGKALCLKKPKPGPFDVIVVSPLLRTLQTAAYHLCNGSAVRVPNGSVVWLAPDCAERLPKPKHQEHMGNTLQRLRKISTTARKLIDSRAEPHSVAPNYPPEIKPDWFLHGCGGYERSGDRPSDPINQRLRRFQDWIFDMPRPPHVKHDGPLRLAIVTHGNFTKKLLSLPAELGHCCSVRCMVSKFRSWVPLLSPSWVLM